jgi:hypothetical protein
MENAGSEYLTTKAGHPAYNPNGLMSYRNKCAAQVGTWLTLIIGQPEMPGTLKW